jgi:hypothetical protein
MPNLIQELESQTSNNIGDTLDSSPCGFHTS